MGRRSKGPRHLLGTRVPPENAARIFELADDSGCSVSDYLATLIAEHLATSPKPKPNRRQEALPLTG